MDFKQIDIKLLDINPSGILIISTDGRIAYANKKTTEILGLPADLISERSYNSPEWKITDFDGNPFPDEDLPFSRVMRNNAPVYDVEHSIVWPDGNRVYLSVNATPINDAENEIEGVFVTIDDISSQVNTGRKLELTEKRYKNLFANLIDEVHIWKFVKDENGQLINWELIEANPKALKNWERSLNEVKGKTADLIFGQEAVNIFKPIVTEILETGIARTWEIYFPPTGQYLSMDSIPLGDYFISTGRDITERKLLENELKRLSLVATKSTNSIVISDGKGRAEWVNEAFQRLTGYAEEEIKGKRIGELLQGEKTEPATVKQISDALKKGQPYSGRILNYTKSGKEYWNELHISPVKDEEGEITNFISIQNNVTRNVKLQASLENSIQEKEALLKEVHHRVKNNLAILAGLLELDIYAHGEYPALKDAINRILSIGMVHELLYQSESLIRINYSEYVEKFIRHFRKSHRLNENIVINTNIRAEHLNINTAVPLGLLINELMTNSIKYAVQDGGTISISLAHTNAKDGTFLFEYSDSGSGFDPSKTPKNSLGMELINTLFANLDAEMKIRTEKEFFVSAAFREKVTGAFGHPV